MEECAFIEQVYRGNQLSSKWRGLTVVSCPCFFETNLALFHLDMAQSALEGAPVEIWEAVIGWVMYDPDAFQLHIDRPSTLCDSRAQLVNFRSQHHTLRLVCKSWNKYVTSAFSITSHTRQGRERFRFASQRYFLTSGEAPWEEIVAGAQSRSLVYFDTALSASSDRTFNRLDWLLTTLAETPLRYLSLLFTDLSPSSFSSPKFLNFSQLHTLCIHMEFEITALPLPSLLRMATPFLRELFIESTASPGIEMDGIITVLEWFGRSLQCLSLQFWDVTTPRVLPDSFWKHVPAIEYLNISGDNLVLLPDHLLTQGVALPSPITLPPTLTILSFIDFSINLQTFQVQQPFVEWLCTSGAREEGQARIQTFRFGLTWRDLLKFTGGDQTLRFQNVFEVFHSQLSHARIRLEDIDQVEMVDVAAVFDAIRRARNPEDAHSIDNTGARTRDAADGHTEVGGIYLAVCSHFINLP